MAFTSPLGINIFIWDTKENIGYKIPPNIKETPPNAYFVLFGRENS
jgi:hypothetical protein